MSLQAFGSLSVNKVQSLRQRNEDLQVGVHPDLSTKTDWPRHNMQRFFKVCQLDAFEQLFAVFVTTLTLGAQVWVQIANIAKVHTV